MRFLNTFKGKRGSQIPFLDGSQEGYNNLFTFSFKAPGVVDVDRLPARLCSQELGRSALSNYSVLGGVVDLTSISDVISGSEAGVRGYYEDLHRSSPYESRAVGCMLGMVIGDALGATMEFAPIDYTLGFGNRAKPGLYVEQLVGGGKFRLLPGQWTDDAAMGLCLADAMLVARGTFASAAHARAAGAVTASGGVAGGAVQPASPTVSEAVPLFAAAGCAGGCAAEDAHVTPPPSLSRLYTSRAADTARRAASSLSVAVEADEVSRFCADLRLRFLMWWMHSYNTPFNGNGSGPRHAVGLGGNIGSSFSEFLREGSVVTSAGDLSTCGNGSVMRNAPVPVGLHNDIVAAQLVAHLQSKTTHMGEEAAELCQVLTFVCWSAMKLSDEDVAAWGSVARTPGGRRVRAALSPQNLARFVKVVGGPVPVLPLTPGVASLLRSEPESSDPDRNFAWREKGPPAPVGAVRSVRTSERGVPDSVPEYRYSPSRAAAMPGYVGSYAMDNIAMCFAVCWRNCDSVEDALLTIANMCGDCDSVGSTVGQVMGAAHGAVAFRSDWIQQTEGFVKGSITARSRALWRGDGVVQSVAPAAVPADSPTTPSTSVIESEQV